MLLPVPPPLGRWWSSSLSQLAISPENSRLDERESDLLVETYRTWFARLAPGVEDERGVVWRGLEATAALGGGRSVAPLSLGVRCTRGLWLCSNEVFSTAGASLAPRIAGRMPDEVGRGGMPLNPSSQPTRAGEGCACAVRVGISLGEHAGVGSPRRSRAIRSRAPREMSFAPVE